MKMMIKLMAIIFAVCFVAASVGCALVSKDSKTPYVYKVYSDTDSTYSIRSDGSHVQCGEYTNPDAPATHSLTYEGETYQLNYVNSERWVYFSSDKYASADGSIEAEYTAGTDELRNVVFNSQDFLPGDDVVTEEDYKLFIKNAVIQFGQEDFDLFTYECTTSCEGEDEDHDEFIPRTEDNSVMCYDFTYTVLKGGVETTDRIYAFMFFDSDLMSLGLSFNLHEFDDVTVPNINESRLNATISAGMQTHVDDCLEEGYVYDGSWTLDNAKWRMINGVPTYVCNIGVSYGMTDGEEGYAEVVTFEIQTTVENGEATE